MVLVDTSVWIDHFRSPNETLKSLLRTDRVLVHPFVIGELACGNLRNREETLGSLFALPYVKVASDAEAYNFIEIQHLYGAEMGFLDIHLLSACYLTRCELWTRDKALLNAAAKLKIRFA
jgi:predicted nucleic acid-binding protein